jgi:nucleoside 2-deoxyribosyltransferase
MKVYVAAMYPRKDEVSGVVQLLEQDGYIVTSTWHKELYSPNIQLHEVTDDERKELAVRDIAEIDAADALLLLTQPPTQPTVRGGRHVEFGYALGKGKRVVCFGPAENIFHHLPNVAVAKTYSDAIFDLGEPDSATEEIRVTDPKTGGQKGVKPARMDLIPPEPLWQLALVYGMGAKKYSDDNWRKGYAWKLSIGALLRHVFQFVRGEYIEPESGLPHLVHATWHCFTLMEFNRLKLGTDDRYITKDTPCN